MCVCGWGLGAELQQPLSPTFGPCSKLSMACAEAPESGVWPLQASQVAPVIKYLLANTEDLRHMGSITGLGSSSAEGHDNPLQYSCLENPHGQRNLAGYSPWGVREPDMTEAT